MNNNFIEKEMYNRAVEFTKQRFPKGWGGAGIVHTNKDSYFISIAPDVFNGALALCIETGAMLEAEKYNEKITHSLCITREDEHSEFKILTPCGICQERLRYWSENVRIGVTTENNELKFIELKELQAYHWTNAYDKDELEHYKEEK